MREQTEKRQKHPKSCLALGIKCSQISASTKILRSDGTKDVSKSCLAGLGIKCLQISAKHPVASE